MPNVLSEESGVYRLKDLMQLLRVSRGTVLNWEAAGVLPKAVTPKTMDGKRHGRTRWWLKSEVHARMDVFATSRVDTEGKRK